MAESAFDVVGANVGVDYQLVPPRVTALSLMTDAYADRREGLNWPGPSTA